jgi:hypothetical protein
MKKLKKPSFLKTSSAPHIALDLLSEVFPSPKRLLQGKQAVLPFFQLVRFRSDAYVLQAFGGAIRDLDHGNN